MLVIKKLNKNPLEIASDIQKSIEPLDIFNNIISDISIYIHKIHIHTIKTIRSVYSIFGSADPKKLPKQIGHTFWLKKEATKHRYIYFLGTKKENRKFHSVMKHPVMKYPKNYKHDIEIRKIEVDDDKWKN